MQAFVREERRKHTGRLDIRLLDFNARPIHVVEPDGRVILESATESMDIVLGQIPAVQSEGEESSAPVTV